MSSAAWKWWTFATLPTNKSATCRAASFNGYLLPGRLPSRPVSFFLDEPFVGIDLVSERIIVDLLKKLRKEGKTILVVHHDLHEVEEYFDKTIILNKKLIAFGDVDTTFTSHNIQSAYGASLGNVQIKGLGGVQA